jgi:perosamine synthetase
VAIRFADIDPVTLNIDPKTIEAKITKRTKAIFVMHYGGNPVDMDPVMDIAKKHGLAVVEDAAHAPGAEYKGRKIGSIADITCFSFHSLKNMSTLGEGGMLTTNNPQYADAVKKLRTMGILGEKTRRGDTSMGPYAMPAPQLKDHSDGSYNEDFTRIDEWGNNFRMSELQAAVGSVQLRKLDGMNRQRKAAAELLSVGLSHIDGIRTPQTMPGSLNVWHLYPCFIDGNVIRATRDEFIHYLEQQKKIQIILRYFPVHLSDYMRFLGHSFGECPVCEKVWFEQQLNLPINPRIGEDEIGYMVESIEEAVKHFK